MKHLYIYMFDAMMLFYIFLPSRPNIDPSRIMIDHEALWSFGVDHRVQKCGHLCSRVSRASLQEFPTIFRILCGSL
jgi:hypothetical protein